MCHTPALNPSSFSRALGLHACTPVLSLPQYSSLEMWLVSAEREGWWTLVCFCSELTIVLWLMFKRPGVPTKDLAYDNIACDGGAPPWVCMQLSFPKMLQPLSFGPWTVRSQLSQTTLWGHFGGSTCSLRWGGVGSLDHLAVSVEVSLCTQFTTQSFRLDAEALGFDPYFNMMSS